MCVSECASGCLERGVRGARGKEGEGEDGQMEGWVSGLEGNENARLSQSVLKGGGDLWQDPSALSFFPSFLSFSL